MENKYQALGGNLFGFEVFEEIFKVINERGYGDQEQMFKAGVASAEAAVRRLREEYYETLKFLADEPVV
jgi:Ran GTPase-activating protein (RanGAP) involved in mRNA processing and transport